MDQTIKGEIDLIDCYHLAVDFGLPAAEKAVTIINVSLCESQELAAVEDDA